MTEQLTFNGVNGSTGTYGLQLDENALAAVVRDQPDPANIEQLEDKHQRNTTEVLGVINTVDADSLLEAGWGAIFATANADLNAQVKEALQPLLNLRREQAGERFRLFYKNKDAYRTPRNETALDFLGRHGVGPGPVDPELGVPYYLLIVGSPAEIPYSFQFQLAVQFAVGRLHFDTVDEYAQYARSVVAVEQGGIELPRDVAFFNPLNPDDNTTPNSYEYLTRPLIKKIPQVFQKELGNFNWNLREYAGEQASKSQLLDLMGGQKTPAMLFTASHGMEFNLDDSRQLPHQGGLLCQDWPGPINWRGKAVPQDFYVAGDDLDSTQKLLGLISFHYACYGAGTPQYDEFYRQAGDSTRAQIAPKPFVGGLPKRMLSHPNGSALAVISHVERAWGYSFSWGKAGPQTSTYQDVLTNLLTGRRVGHAVESLNNRYAQLATELTHMLEQLDAGKRIPSREVVGLWTAHNDARDYIILGDPATRLNLVKHKAEQTEREIVTLTSQAMRPKYLLDEIMLNRLLDQTDPDALDHRLESAKNKLHFASDQRLRAVLDREPKQLGWGVIWGKESDPEIKAALEPLLALRRSQFGDRFYEFDGLDSLKQAQADYPLSIWHQIEAAQLPYYLLLVGDVTDISMTEQNELGMFAAVGRVYFDSVFGYANYVKAVIAAEQDNQLKLARQVGVFAPTDNDLHAQRHRQLIEPLLASLKQSDWQVSPHIGEQATKAALSQQLGGAETPAFLFISGNGAAYAKHDTARRNRQGGVICAGLSPDAETIPPEQTFTSEDIAADGQMAGLIAFQMVDYGASTPIYNDLELYRSESLQVSPEPFMARLPQRLLAHEQGGALAVISYGDLVWDYGFAWDGLAKQGETVITFVSQLLAGKSVGQAFELFRQRQAEIELETDHKAGLFDHDLQLFGGLWSAGHDLRHCVILGDPAVRLAVASADETPLPRPVIARAEGDSFISGRQTKIAKPAALDFISDNDWLELSTPVKQFLTNKAKLQAYVDRL